MSINTKNQTHTRINKTTKARVVRWAKKKGFKSMVEALDVLIKRGLR